MITNLFLGRDPTDSIYRWSEDQIQQYIVQEARREGYFVSASMEQGKRSKSAGGRAKAMGMVAGMPDLNFWIDGGDLKMIELKIPKERGGKLSPAQKKAHLWIDAHGYSVDTVYAKSPADGWEQVKRILK